MRQRETVGRFKWSRRLDIMMEDETDLTKFKLMHTGTISVYFSYTNGFKLAGFSEGGKKGNKSPCFCNVHLEISLCIFSAAGTPLLSSFKLLSPGRSLTLSASKRMLLCYTNYYACLI